MIGGGPSSTARRVAAYRLRFERVATDYGDPAGDERLARDVAGTKPFEPSEGMERYLRARTAFFDRVVVGAIAAGSTQLVSIGAGYDARSLRYGAPGVRWFEVDHPSTGADKATRLARLGIPTTGVSFVRHDLAGGGLSHALAAEGFDPSGHTQFLCEGVAVYLEPAVLEQLLRDVHGLSSPVSRLAISLSVQGAAMSHRARFQRVVSDLGEPVRSPPLSLDEETALLTATGWQRVESSPSATRTGLAQLAPRP